MLILSEYKVQVSRKWVYMVSLLCVLQQGWYSFQAFKFHDFPWCFWVFHDQSLAAVFTVVSFNNHLFNLFSSIIMDKMHACVYFVDSYVIFSIFAFPWLSKTLTVAEIPWLCRPGKWKIKSITFLVFHEPYEPCTAYIDSILELKIKFYSSNMKRLLVCNVGTLYTSLVQ